MQRQPLVHDRVFDDPEWARRYARREGPRGTRRGRRYARELTRLGFRGGRILDVGCGPGTVAVALARELSRSEVVGLDLSEPLLRMARAHARREGVELTDVLEIPYPADSFNAVLCASMLHIVADPAALLSELERLLHPEGQLLVCDIRRSWIGWLEPVFRTAWTLEEGRAAVMASPLRPVIFRESFLWWDCTTPAPERVPVV